MAHQDLFGLPGLKQPLTSVVTDSFKKAIARLIDFPVHNEQRLAGQLSDPVEDEMAIDLDSSANRLGAYQAEASDKDREPSQNRLLRFGEQVIAPVNSCLKRLVAGNGTPAAPREQAESFVQPVGDLAYRQDTDLRRGKFDRERNAIQSAAY